MNISEVAKKTNISTDTLRYYERIGLIPPVPRKSSGIRTYDERFVQWIEMIQNLKSIGMPLEKIIDYMALARQGSATSAQRRDLIEEIQDELRQKISSLQSMLSRTNYQLDNYDEILLPQTSELMQHWHTAV